MLGGGVVSREHSGAVGLDVQAKGPLHHLVTAATGTASNTEGENKLRTGPAVSPLLCHQGHKDQEHLSSWWASFDVHTPLWPPCLKVRMFSPERHCLALG